MLTDTERRLLSGKNFIYIATINADGSPQVSPVWVELDGELIVINSQQGRAKVRNMARDPRVALSLYDQDDPYDQVSLRGKVVEITEAGGRAHIDKLSLKYLGKPYPWHNDVKHQVIIKIQKL